MSYQIYPLLDGIPMDGDAVQQYHEKVGWEWTEAGGISPPYLILTAQYYTQDYPTILQAFAFKRTSGRYRKLSYYFDAASRDAAIAEMTQAFGNDEAWSGFQELDVVREEWMWTETSYYPSVPQGSGWHPIWDSIGFAGALPPPHPPVMRWDLEMLDNARLQTLEWYFKRTTEYYWGLWWRKLVVPGEANITPLIGALLLGGLALLTHDPLAHGMFAHGNSPAMRRKRRDVKV